MQVDILKKKKKKNGNKDLIFGDSVNENKGLLKKYTGMELKRKPKH